MFKTNVGGLNPTLWKNGDFKRARRAKHLKKRRTRFFWFLSFSWLFNVFFFFYVFVDFFSTKCKWFFLVLYPSREPKPSNTNNNWIKTTIAQRIKRLNTVPYFTVFGQIISIYRHTKTVYGNIRDRIQAFFTQWHSNENGMIQINCN